MPDALYTSDSDGVVAAKYVIMPCHETGDGTPKAWAVLDQEQMIRQMKVGSVWGLALLWAILRDNKDRTTPRVTDAFRTEARQSPSLPREKVNLLIALAIGSIVGDPLYAAIIDDPHGNANDCDVGHVAKLFKARVAMAGASRNFPARGAPLTPDAFARSLANCLVRVIRALPQQQQNRIWRRFRNYEIYLA